MANPPKAEPDIELQVQEAGIRISQVSSDMGDVEGIIIQCPEGLRLQLAQLPLKANIEKRAGLQCRWREVDGSKIWMQGLILGMAEGRLVFRRVSEPVHGSIAGKVDSPKVGITCGRCSRVLPAGTTRCIYCGWTEDAALQETSDAGRVQKGTYRSGGTLWPFLGSAFLLGCLAGLIAMMGWKDGPPAPDELGPIVIAIGVLLFFGPVLCIVQILRRKLLWIHIDPDKGLETRKGGFVPWNHIRSIERYAGAFAYKDTFEQMAGQIPHGMAAAKVGCFLIPVMVMYFVFIPVISVLSPWHARVTIHLTDGSRIVLRDLEDSDSFTRMVRYKLEATDR